MVATKHSGGRNRRSDSTKRREGRRVDQSHKQFEIQRPPTPHPPEHLSATEAKAWRSIIASLPQATRFDPGLLESYVVTITTQRDLKARGLVTIPQIRAYTQLGELLRKLAAEIQSCARFEPVMRPMTLEEWQGEAMALLLDDFENPSPGMEVAEVRRARTNRLLAARPDVADTSGRTQRG